MEQTIKKYARRIFSFEKRAKIFWRYNALKLAFSSAYNAARNSGEFNIAKKFRLYLAQHSAAEIDKIISALKKGLDINEQTEIDALLARQEYIYTHNLLEQKKLFGQNEKAEQKICSQESGYARRQLKKYSLKTFSAESFYGLNGLRWLPAEATDKIKGGVFLDIGAYDGDSALAFQRAFEPSKIYAFEPESNNYQRLSANSQKLGNNIIQPIKYGVSDHAGIEYISHENSGSKTGQTQNGEKIELITIDEFVEQNQLSQVSVIKMDIEGEETKALAGAITTIKKFKPTLAISIYHRPEDFFLIKPWLELAVPEYKFIIKKANPLSLTHEVMLIAYIN